MFEVVTKFLFILHLVQSSSYFTSMSLHGQLHPPIIVGLNPALQRTIAFSRLVPGAVNRGSHLSVGIGGKGQNCAIACKILADNACSSQRPQLLQLVGKGYEGDQLQSLMLKAGIISSSSELDIRFDGRCRTCITLLDDSTGN